MLDYIPEPREIKTSRLNEPCPKEIVGNGLPGCFQPGDFGEKPQKPQRTVIDIVKENTELIAGCSVMAREISTFLLNKCDETVNKPEVYCMIDEIECQRIDLHTLQTQIVAELGA